MRYVHVAVTWYHQLMCDPKILSSFSFDFMKEKTDSAKPFALSDYDTIKQRLVKNTLEALAKADIELEKHIREGKGEDIEKFLLAKEGDKIQLPEGISEDLCDKLSFLHSEVLISPATWNSIPWVKYGLFPEKKGFSVLAGPYDGAHCPKIGSQFAHLTEFINYVIQMRLLEGIDASTLMNELRRMQDAVQDEMQNTLNYDPVTTEAYKEYVEVFGPVWARNNPLYDLDLEDLGLMKEFVDNTPSVLLACVERYVLPTIPVYKESLISDGQCLQICLEALLAFTGTPNADNAPERFRHVLDKSTDGKMLRTLWKNSRANFHFLRKENDSLAALQEWSRIKKH